MIVAMDAESDDLRAHKSPYGVPSSVAVYARVAVPLQFGPPARDLVEILNLSRGAIVLDVAQQEPAPLPLRR
jgi:hypothetical protein